MCIINIISLSINILVLQMLENPQNLSVCMCESDLLSAVTCLACGHFTLNLVGSMHQILSFCCHPFYFS